jgi:hypothetical protein
MRLRKWLIYSVSFCITGAGSFLIYKTFARAIEGEKNAVWLLTTFTMAVVVLIFLVKKYWILVLDDRDALDIFKIASINNEATLAHFQREFDQPDGVITERGYSYTLRDGNTEIRTSLVYIGKEFAGKKTVIGERALVTIALRVGQPFRMAVVNPQVDIRESLDIEFYAPIVLHSKKYTYSKYGIVFSDYDKTGIQTIFENPFLQTQLIELFVRSGFKFIVFDERRALAVKSAAVEGIARDVETYPVLMSISQLISTQHKKYIIQ